MLELVPKPVRRIARRWIERRSFIPPSQGPANIHIVMRRRSLPSVQTVIDVGASDGRWLREVMRYYPAARYLLIEAQERAQASPTAYLKNNIVVPMETVDGLVRKHGLSGPFLLKLDTHGFEVAIFEGAVETLANCTMLIVEAYNFTLCPGCLRFHELCAYLEEHGFRCVDVFDTMVRPRDQAFWQMDMVFIPASEPVFQVAEFR
jgi:hypothetical protein